MRAPRYPKAVVVLGVVTLLIIGCGDDEVTNPPPGPTGTVTVSTASIGSAIDADGYTVLLNGSDTGPIGANSSVSVGVAVGEYVVELTGLADNCGVIGGNPIAVTIVAEQATPIEFSVACPPFYDYIAFYSSRDGTSGIFVMRPDGSELMNLTPDTTRHYSYPAWAPDATQISFTSVDDIWILNTATMQARQLTDGVSVQLSAWSPDGTRIAYDTFFDCPGSDTCGDIYVMNADGSGLVNLTPGPARGSEPAWSPDGSQIAFRSEVDGFVDIWVMEVDGSNAMKLTDLEALPTGLYLDAYEPAWSPDGARIAFAGPGMNDGPRIWVMDADGSNLTMLTEYEPYYHAWRPSWSPDGTRIAFWAYKGFAEGPEKSYEIYVMDADGSNEVNLTNYAGYDVTPTWSPGQ